MESAISRGRLLRELLKQDRLTPYRIEFQMAWLIAFNDGLLSNVPLESLAAILETLNTNLESSNLTLDSTRNEWVDAIRDWLKAANISGNDSSS